MRVEYISPFVESAHDVLKNLIRTTIEKGSFILKDSLTAEGVSATVFLSGNVEGRVLLDIEPQLAIKIAGRMNDMEFDRLDHLAVDTICELTNMIIGQAVTLLNNKGFRFKTSPPCFFIGKKQLYGLESLCISLFTEWGEVKIQAAIKERVSVAV
jgi:chemotaxis protein CheX